MAHDIEIHGLILSGTLRKVRHISPEPQLKVRAILIKSHDRESMLVDFISLKVPEVEVALDILLWALRLFGARVDGVAHHVVLIYQTFLGAGSQVIVDLVRPGRSFLHCQGLPLGQLIIRNRRYVLPDLDDLFGELLDEVQFRFVIQSRDLALLWLLVSLVSQGVLRLGEDGDESILLRPRLRIRLRYSHGICRSLVGASGAWPLPSLL